MRRRLSLAATALAILLSMGTLRPGSAQEVCPGDVDGDGQVTTADTEEFAVVLFGDAGDDSTQMRADANGDGILSAVDIIAIVGQEGSSCEAASPTPSATQTPALPTETPTPESPTPTPTPDAPTATATTELTPTLTSTVTLTATPTITPTPTLTPTPTATCQIHVAQFGSTDGELTSGDCQRELRYTDVYTIVGTPGQSITIDVAATAPASPFVPYVSVIDADGQFAPASNAPPLQFVVSVGQPYEIWVTSDPKTAQQLGSYRLTLTSAPCPPSVNLSFGASRRTTLDGTECPDPGAPVIGDLRNIADIYTFSVSAVPTNVSITLQQLSDNIAPALSILGPDGFRVVTEDVDQYVDCTPPDAVLACRQIRFLALQSGVYTIIATGGGRTGRYSLALSSPGCHAKALNNIPVDMPLTCPGQDGPGCMGTFNGSTDRTPCAAPLPIPGFSDKPELGSPADLYTFTADSGQVISVEMNEMNDEAHVYLLGPASAGNPLVAVDNGSDDFGRSGSPQLAATLVSAGTYTIVVAHNSSLTPPDPEDPEDTTGETVNYTLLVQKCRIRGELDPNTGATVTSKFSKLDCFGFGGIPFRTYSFNGTAGQFVSAAMSSSDVDAFIRIFAPDGSLVANDNDLFDPDTSDARANRVLPMDGEYFVEVSSSIEVGEVDVDVPTLPEFSVQAVTCPTNVAVPGDVSGAFTEADCTLPTGRKFDVWRLSSPVIPLAVSVLPPSNGCVVALLAAGPQAPEGGCRKQAVEFPLSNGTAGFIIAADDETTRGPYQARFASCPLSTISYGSIQTGTLTGANCAAASGDSAAWFLLLAPTGLVQFSEGISGTVTASFPVAGTLSDTFGPTPFSGAFSEDPSSMFPFGGDLAALVKITGATPADRGSYTLQIPSAWFR